jgi:hypothetical protein
MENNKMIYSITQEEYNKLQSDLKKYKEHSADGKGYVFAFAFGMIINTMMFFITSKLFSDFMIIVCGIIYIAELILIWCLGHIFRKYSKNSVETVSRKDNYITETGKEYQHLIEIIGDFRWSHSPERDDEAHRALKLFLQKYKETPISEVKCLNKNDIPFFYIHNLLMIDKYLKEKEYSRVCNEIVDILVLRQGLSYEVKENLTKLLEKNLP